MIAEVRGFMTRDADPLESFYPDDPTCFEVDVEAVIGTKGSEGADIFIFKVVTPSFLDKKYDEDDAVFLRHMILVKQWDTERIKSRIIKLVNSVSGKDWSELSHKIGKYGAWEFEDYKPAQ